MKKQGSPKGLEREGDGECRGKIPPSIKKRHFLIALKMLWRQEQ